MTEKTFIVTFSYLDRFDNTEYTNEEISVEMKNINSYSELESKVHSIIFDNDIIERISSSVIILSIVPYECYGFGK